MTIRAIVTDIEGTTSSISFVHQVLFPYAREHLAAYVRQHAGEAKVRRELEAVKAETGAAGDEAAITELLDWIEQDRKATPLKSLQGYIWEAGYRDGAFTGHVYPDAAATLRRWHEQGLALYVYSSGSVAAQKLLFGFSDAGDLTPLFSGYFDTRIGHKREADAYRNILDTIGLAGADVLFLSDIPAELDAARAAGMATCLLVRGDEPGGAGDHRQAASFDAVPLD